MPSSSDHRSKNHSDSFSSAEVMPLEVIRMDDDDDHQDHSQSDMALAITTSAASFQLPDDWVVEIKQRPRRCVNQTPDKYYYEPETGRKFRSLVSVKRYLAGGEEYLPMPKASQAEEDGAMNLEIVRRIVYNGKMWKPDELEVARRIKDVTPTAVQHKLSSLLPDGWIVEDVPRKSCLKSDRYFLEPLTGMKFHSVPEVRNYLADEIVKLENFDSSNPPEKVEWRLACGLGEDNWNPFVEDSRIPDHVKELWQDSFFLGMTGKSERQIPQLTMGEASPT